MAFGGLQDPGGEGGSPPGGGGSSGGGSSGGGVGGGAHGNFDHNDQMLKAFFGYDPAAKDYTQEVPGAWEARQQYTTGPWLEADRMFGAFVVANLNDSDSDQIVDHEDPSVVGNGRAAEPDLIKLVITIPQWGPNYECSVEGFHTDFLTNTTTSTQAIRFFGSNTKGSLNGMAGITPWPGGVVDPQNPSYTPAKGFSITQAGTYTVYPPKTEDEKPNDSGFNGDIDFVVPRTNGVITVVDSPAAEVVQEDQDQEHRFGIVSFTFEGNPDYLRFDVEAKEFVRISFTGPPVTYESPRDIVWGTRASNKVLWYSKHSCEPDEQRPTGHSLGIAPMFYAQDRDMFTNEIGLGEFPDGNFFDAVWPGRHPY